MRVNSLAALLLLASAAQAGAHPLHGVVEPGEVLRSWTFEPGVVIPLALSATLYAAGVARLWRSAGTGRGIGPWRIAAFAAGWVALAAALVSPLDALSDALFSAHMFQHELLIVVAAPLIVLGTPGLASVWAFPRRQRRQIGAFVNARPVVVAWTGLSAPAIVCFLHAVALLAWHVPALFQATLNSDAVHAAQHLSFFGTAALFWWGIAHGRYGRLSYGAAVLYVFATATYSGVLGALLTVAPRVWYPIYASRTAAWGLTPLEDQQLAGLIMWVPASVAFVAAGLGFFAAWLRESDRRVQRGRYRTVRSRLAIFVFAVVALISSACGSREAWKQAALITGGDPGRGPAAIAKYGCNTCHTIPGIRTARGLVGPPLTGVAERVYIAGHVPNTPSNMQAWIQHPHQLEPHTVMPEMGVSETDARDISAYLYTLR